MNATVATSVFGVFMVATVALGLLATRGRRKGNGEGGGLAEWSVGGRSLGTVFIWVLMAGEGYTSFSYLGAAGWGYNYGAPVLYVVAYMSCGYAIGYVVGPMLWAYARKHGLVGITDMVAHRFGRPWLGALVAVLATVFLLPYIQLQITGMGVVVSTISYGAISLNWAYFIAFAVTTGFVVVSGLRGSAWVSVLKDILVIATLGFLAFYVPMHYFDGYGPFLDRLVTEKSEWLTFPGHGDSGLGQAWFITTSFLNSLTVVIFPTTVAGYLGASSADVLRRNAMLLPAYNVLLFVPMLLGMAALFVVPGLVGAESNLALFQLVVDSLPAWAVGVVGVAAALSSIVPMAVFMLVIGTMWGRSVLARTALGAAAEGRGAGGRRGRGEPRAAAHVHRSEHPGAALPHFVRGNGAAAPHGAAGADVAAADPARGDERSGRRRGGGVRVRVHGERSGVGGERGHRGARSQPRRRAGGDVRGAARARRPAGRRGARPGRDRGPGTGGGTRRRSRGNRSLTDIGRTGAPGPSCITAGEHQARVCANGTGARDRPTGREGEEGRGR